MKSSALLLLFFLIHTSVFASTISMQKAEGYNKNVRWAFEENRGQVTGSDSSSVLFHYKSGNMTLFLTKSGISYQFDKIHYPAGFLAMIKQKGRDSIEKLEQLSKQIRVETYRMDIAFEDANPNPQIITEGKSADYIQYYNHNVLDVHAYQKITYKNIYPNIDWVIYIKSASTSDQGLTTNDYVKYDFIVHPGGNPADIKLKTNWVEDLAINKDGSLSLSNRMGTITEKTPISFQADREVKTAFKLNDKTISFNLDHYDLTKDLVIDPTLAWSTYYGGTLGENLLGLTTDQANNVYICGLTYSQTMIASGGHQNNKGFFWNAYLVKFDKDGNRIWATYYGGNDVTEGFSCSTDKNDNVYLTGYTWSHTNIATGGFLNTYPGTTTFPFCLTSSFLVKFNSAGVRQWGTYYGWNAIGTGCTTDGSGNVIMTGFADSSAYNHTNLGYNGHQNAFGGGIRDGFIVKFSSSGARLWSSFYGGNEGIYSIDRIYSVCTDKYDNIYFSGNSTSPSGIASGGYRNTLQSLNVLGDHFLVKMNSAGVRQWGTYYGETGGRISNSCCTDTNGNVYLCGTTGENTSIALNGHINYNNGFVKAFLVKFNGSGARIWGTYYGDTTFFSGLNSSGSLGYSCSTDKNNNVYLCGLVSKYSGDIAFNGFQSTTNAGNPEYSMDFFLAKFNSTGLRQWGTYYGGAGYENDPLCATNNLGDVFLAGRTDTADIGLPTWAVSTNLGYRGLYNTFNGYEDGVLAKICGTVDTAKIIITASANNVCAGKNIDFGANPILGGMNPQFIWKLNGTLVGGNSQIYSTSTIQNNDSIECIMISSASCLYKDTVVSNRIKMIIKPAIIVHKYDTICSNQNYPFNSQLLNTTGIYKDTFTSSSGCDSFIFLHLEVKPFSFSSYNHTTTCTNPSYFFNNQTFTQSGAYKDTFIAANGCDSIVTVFLTIKGNTSFNIPPVSICPGQPYFFNGQNRTTAGTYTQTLTNSVGCDSIITLTLSYLTTPTGVNNIIWACNPYMFKGKTFTSNGIVIDTIKSSFGCDSLYRFNYIYLKSKPDTLKSNNLNVCDSVIYKNIVHKTSFSYTDTIRTTQNVVCDSLYQITNYTIKYTPTIILSTKQEDTFFKGENIIISANNIKNYRWSTGETKRDISFKLTQNESIFLIAWNDPECQDTAYTNITALDETILEFPTGFSPSSKKPENQVFRPNIVGKIERIQLDIFNRLGEKVYSSNNLFLLGWDGTFKGAASPQGVYTYLIEYVSNKRIFFKSGEVELVR